MPRYRLDPILDFPRPARDPGAVAPAEGGLSRTRPADARPRTLAGARSLVRYTAEGGVDEVQGGTRLVGPVRALSRRPDEVTETPRTLTRHDRSTGADEVVILPERLPGCAFQWLMHRPPAAPLPLEVALPAADGPLRVAVEGPLLRWAADDAPTGAVLQLVGAVAEGWTVAEAGGGLVARAVLEPTPDHPATLLISGVEADGRLPSLAALAALAAHRRRDHLEPDEAEGVVLESGRPALDRGIAWARAALRSRLDETPGAPAVRGTELGDVARGALAAGELAVARAALTTFVPAGHDDIDTLALGVAWTGRGPELLAHRAALDRLAADAPPPVRRRLADAAEAAGEEEWAAALRLPPSPTGGRRLPTVGRAPASPPPGAASGPSTPADEVPPPPDVPDVPDVNDLRTALAVAGGSGVGWSIAVLERTLERLERGDLPRESTEAALALDLFLRGVLGIVPDAAYGRIEIAPALPAGWGPVTVRGIALEDARVGFRIRSDAGRVEIALHQTAGGAPVTWILSPRLEGAAIASVRVDGQPAEIDSRIVGDRIQPRIQLPAERERIVQLEVSPP